jgi:hypothetical protein
MQQIFKKNQSRYSEIFNKTGEYPQPIVIIILGPSGHFAIKLYCLLLSYV